MSVRVTIDLFAGMRAAAGADQITVELPPSATPQIILHAVAEAAPATASLAAVSRVALDDQFLTKTAAITSASRIAIIPPVSGG